MNVKKSYVILPLFLLLFSAQIVSQQKIYPFENKTYFVPGMIHITLRDGSFGYLNLYQEYNRPDIEPENLPKTDSGPYTIREEHGYTIIRGCFTAGTRDLIVFYLGEQLVVYDPFFGESLFASIWEGDGFGLYYSQKITASSYLTETLGNKPVSYPPSNLSNWELSTAWVEGVPGDGIGEEISLLTGGNHLIIANGFFYPKDLSVYTKNNRVRRILVSGSTDGIEQFSMEYELTDTPNFQAIIFPQMVMDVKITILSVYKGTTYSDTAISGIYKDGYLLEQLR